jgi:tetratricopeptide (TPR) repeat protein
MELYDESTQVSLATLERFEASIGPRHTTIVLTRLDLAWTLYKQGKFEDSEIAYKYLLELQSQSKCQIAYDTANILAGLAQVLWELKRRDEAISYYEKVFQIYAEIFGPDDQKSYWVCEELGLCYELEGRTDDAVELYRQMINMLQQSGFSDHHSVAKYQWQIDGLTKAPASDFP